MDSRLRDCLFVVFLVVIVLAFIRIMCVFQSQNTDAASPLVAVMDIGNQLKFSSESSGLGETLRVVRASIDEQLTQKAGEGKKPTYVFVEVTIRFSEVKK